MENEARLKAELIASFESTGYTKKLAVEIANKLHNKLTRKETENDGNSQGANSGPAK